jgi:hypothetical protein
MIIRQIFNGFATVRINANTNHHKLIPILLSGKIRNEYSTPSTASQFLEQF